MRNPDEIVAKTIRERLAPEQRNVADILERIEAYYVPTHNDPEAKREIDVVTRGASRALKSGDILLITGESQIGKSSLIKYWLDREEALKPIQLDELNMAQPIFTCEAPPRCAMVMLGREMAMKLGFPQGRQLQEDIVFQRVRAQLRVQGVKVVHIDEFQHMLNAPSPKGRQHLIDRLKGLLQENDWPIHIILSGLPESAQIYLMDTTDQMEARVIHHALSELNVAAHADQVKGIIEEVLEIAGMSSAFPLDDSEFIQRLMHGGRNRIGLIIKMLRYAIEDALDCGQIEVGIENWKAAYMRLAKRGRNVFADDEWWTIIRGVRSDGTLTEESMNAGKGKRGKRSE